MKHFLILSEGSKASVFLVAITETGCGTHPALISGRQMYARAGTASIFLVAITKETPWQFSHAMVFRKHLLYSAFFISSLCFFFSSFTLRFSAQSSSALTFQRSA